MTSVNLEDRAMSTTDRSADARSSRHVASRTGLILLALASLVGALAVVSMQTAEARGFGGFGGFRGNAGMSRATSFRAPAKTNRSVARPDSWNGTGSKAT